MVTLLAKSIDHTESDEKLVEIVEEYRENAMSKIAVIPIKGVISGEGPKGGASVCSVRVGSSKEGCASESCPS